MICFCVSGKRRVSNVKINGEKLNLNKMYNASLIEYNANGGGGYSMFVPFEIFNESLITDTDALCYYIKNNLNGNIPEDYKNVQGRINLYNNSNSRNSDSSRITLGIITIVSIVIILWGY